MKPLLISIIFFFIFGCTDNNQFKSGKGANDFKVFSEINPSKSNIFFNNQIIEDGNINYFMYTYLYNGGGVGIADINNDNLPDIYFTSTQGTDKLFLNQGGFKFIDISKSSGIERFSGYKTGVNFVDVNNDGWIDIYVCRSGWFDDSNQRTNLLFINKKDNTFEESAAAYGLNDSSRSIQSVFFDYDKDGDLDLYLSNHPKIFRQPIGDVIEKIKNPTYENSDKFYIKNEDGTYTESGKQVGIYNHGWGLGLVAGDLNNDGWTDIYVSNDFQTHDYYYLNNGDGTFTESLKKFFPHTSYFAMGVDLVDINNDKFLDIFVGEMLSENNLRQKTNMAPMNPETFKLLVNSGQHYQYMRNSFHLNNGNGHFSDIADYSGIAKTDWSWSSLFGDYDNDGDNDLLVVNGWLKDTQDKDFSKNANAFAQKFNNKLSYEQVNTFLKSTPLNNYAFEYEGNFKFQNVSDKWGFNFKGFSNGMAYGDLDNDGDLDVVVNNINANASIYKNNSEGDFLKLKLIGHKENKSGLNSKITLFTNEGIQYKEFQTTRGFQSSCEPMIHFGLSPTSSIDSLMIEWPDGKVQIIGQVTSNETVVANYKDARKKIPVTSLVDTQFTELDAKNTIDFKHEEIYYDDYEVEVLLPHQLSQLGPALAVADVDGNGLEDIFIGGAHQQTAALFLQTAPQIFEKRNKNLWSKDAKFEDVDALFFDADNDQDLDLYVASGSNEFIDNPQLYTDRLYLNNGKGEFKKSTTLLPEITTSTGNISSCDYDKDGDQDLFIGGRVVPGQYPKPAESLLLQNNADGFKIVTKEVAPELERAGLIQSSVWSDYNNDGYMDLIVVGEWTDIMFFKNNGNSLQLEDDVLEKKMVGWWNNITVADLDKDGDDDYILGNLGENYKYKAGDKNPFEIFSGDFDNNHKQDIVLGYYSGNNLFPVRGFQCSSEQMPGLYKQFDSYEAFGKADVFEIYGEQLNSALHYQANNFSSVLLWNNGDASFTTQKLPPKAQLAPVQDFIVNDFDKDDDLDILLAGNWYVSEVETPRADSGTGLLLKNHKGQFIPEPIPLSGFFANKDVRKIDYVSCGTKPPLVIVANNNDRVQVFQSN